jgi:hypothetical protein
MGDSVDRDSFGGRVRRVTTYPTWQQYSKQYGGLGVTFADEETQDPIVHRPPDITAPPKQAGGLEAAFRALVAELENRLGPDFARQIIDLLEGKS